MSGGARAQTAPEPSGATSGGMPGTLSTARNVRTYRRLRPGDRVAVVAPSGPAEPARLAAGCAALRGLGLDVTVGRHTLDRVNLDGSGPARDGWHGLAGGDAERAADLADAWCDPAVRAVICARGGYGATRVLDRLDWAALAAATESDVAESGGPKILHGSSDITALHVAFGTRLDVTTSFGPMPAGLLADPAPQPSGTGSTGIGSTGTEPGGDRAWTADALRGALFGGDTVLPGARALRPGRAEAPLTGGTLSLLTALLGTPYAPPPAAGRIVFLEDVTEVPYRIDRMLVQLLQAGWFDGAAGIALGSWEACGDPGELDAVFTARFGALDAPVLAGVPAGHGPRQGALELGAPAVLDTARLTLETPAAGGTR